MRWPGQTEKIFEVGKMQITAAGRNALAAEG
jgi:hypothetical protein